MVGRKLDARIVDAMFAFHLLPSHAKECSRPECSNPCLRCKVPKTVKKQFFSCVYVYQLRLICMMMNSPRVQAIFS